MGIRVEITVYPFRSGGDPPAHVQAAADALSGAGLDVEMGPLALSVTGEVGLVLEVLRVAQQAALDAGATRLAINMELEG